MSCTLLLATPDARYDRVAIESTAAFQQLKRWLGSDGLVLLEKVNRRDRRHVKPGTVLQVPRDLTSPERYVPFPRSLAKMKRVPKIIVVSLRIQAFAAYERGELVWWGPTNTGSSKQPTPATLYHANWKSRRKVSTINSSWIMPWYFNLHSSMGVAFHEYAMPGRPISYGCIRLLPGDARWIYNWADEWIPASKEGPPIAFGTPVIVFGTYDHESEPPWCSLFEDPSAASVTSSELLELFERYTWIIEQRFEERNRVLKETQADSFARLPAR
jgi:hypothetical protein